jgi:tetratricopeptide (TPR) repeat protein
LCCAAVATICAFQLHAQVDEASPDGQRKARNALIGAQDFSSALGVAQKIVAESEASKDPKLPTDIMLLARVQGELNEFDDAEQNYMKAAKLLEQSNGQFSPALVDPYQGLGRLYIKEREFPKALTALRQARYISQRNYGLFNLKQTPLIDDMTTARLGLGDTVAAEQLQQERLRNAIKELGDDDPKVIPYRYRLARYYERSRLLGSAREQLHKAASSLEKRGGPQDPRLLEPLRAMTQIDIQLGGTDKARNRLAAVLQANGEYDAGQRALSEAVLGDWDLVHGDLEAARSHYFLAYETLANEQGDAARKTFGTPRMIDFVEPLSPVDKAERRRPYSWGTIVIRFDVSAEGRASNVTAESVKPPERVGDAYRRRIRETHFRPALVDGRPVATPHVEYRQSFRYYTDVKGGAAGKEAAPERAGGASGETEGSG